MTRFSDDDIYRIKRIKQVLFGASVQFLGTVNGGLYARDFFIAGGIFANLWHFFEEAGPHIEPNDMYLLNNQSYYSQMFPASDIDFYVKATNGEEYADMTDGLIQHYGSNVKSSVDYQAPAAFTVGMKNYITNTVQVVSIQQGEPDKVVDTFDMEHTKIYYDVGPGTLTISPAQLQLVKNKKIIFDETKCIYDPNVRLQKWKNRGWEIHKNIGHKPTIELVPNNLQECDDIPF